jgi:signal transduction histidine kinase/ActR/RegA family two-component response regulator
LRDRPIVKYVVALGLLLAATLVRYLLEPLVGPGAFVFVTYYAASMLTAWWAGIGPALAVILFGGLTADYLFVQPPFALSLGGKMAVGLSLYVTIATFGAFLAEGSARARSRAEQHTRDLAAQRKILEAEIRARGKYQQEVDRLNASLNDRVQELEAIIESSPIGIAIARDGRCSDVVGNSTFLQLLGVQRSEDLAGIGGASPAGFTLSRGGQPLPPDEWPMQRCARHGARVQAEELEVLHANGRRCTLLANAGPLLDHSGNVRGCVGIFTDISERKRSEEERAEAERRKDEFLAMLGHELRNPLAPIKNGIAILQGRSADAQRRTWALDVMDRQLAQLTRLVDELLELSRISQGRIVLEKRPSEIGDVVLRAVETARPAIDAHGHELVLDIPGDSICIHTDPLRLAQAITNLLLNAAKFTPVRGRIRLSAEVGCSDVRIVVADNGKGIEARLLPHIFDLFAQGERGLDRSEGGLGIGLTLVRRIVELHGGTVTAASDGPGRGSTFTLVLPLALLNDVAEKAEPDITPVPTGPARRVLIVDDNRDVVDSTATLLEMRGHEVCRIYEGTSAVEAALAFEPDVVILDIGLPVLDGYQVARLFRAHERLKRLPLIAASGHGQATDQARSLEAGFETHLVKPFDPELLARLIESERTDSLLHRA